MRSWKDNTQFSTLLPLTSTRCLLALPVFVAVESPHTANVCREFLGNPSGVETKHAQGIFRGQTITCALSASRRAKPRLLQKCGKMKRHFCLCRRTCSIQVFSLVSVALLHYQAETDDESPVSWIGRQDRRERVVLLVLGTQWRRHGYS